MKRCCCDCCTVRTGTLIIGILTLIGSTYQVGTYCIGLGVMFLELSTLGDQSAREIKYPYYSDEKVDELSRTFKIGIAVSLAVLILYVIQLCLTISLLRGVSTDNHRAILPWYYYNLIMFVIGVIAAAVGTIWLLFMGQFLEVLCVAIAGTLMFGLWRLFLSVVKDYIDELKTGYIRENLSMVIPDIGNAKTEKA